MNAINYLPDLPGRWWRLRKVPSLFILACFIGFSLALYWSGIQGGVFRFDDEPNLSVLGDFGGVTSYRDLIAYLKSGIAGPTGRPLSLLSFLVDGQTWPTDPKPFLRTNAIIHGINGFLIYVALRLLLKHSSRDTYARHASVIAALSVVLWLAHPYWASTVLYVVQRMAMLSALFCLAGVALYIKARSLTLVDATRREGWWLASTAVVVATGVAALAKENAAVLPLLILVVEFIGIRNLWATSRSRPYERAWYILFLVIPSAALLIYLVNSIDLATFFQAGSVRLFSRYQRLITEPTILLGYLWDLLLPRPMYAGLYQENYPFAANLLSPPAALMSLATLIVGASVLLWKRRQVPLIAFAFLFFFVGHLVESSVLMLELKFEHRNYLPAAFLFLPIAAAIVRAPNHVRWSVAPALVVLLAVFASGHAALWGRPLELAVYWANKNPDSYRAQVAAAAELDRSGRKELALELLHKASLRHPDSPAIRISYAGLLQSRGRTEEARNQAVAAVEAIAQGPFDAHVNSILEPMLDSYISGSPLSLPAYLIEELISAFENRDEYNRADSDREVYEYSRARLALGTGDVSNACKHFLAMQERSGRIGTDILIFSLLASNQYFLDAQYFLDSAKGKIMLGRKAGLRFPADWYYREIDRLERAAAEDRELAAQTSQACCGRVLSSTAGCGR